MGNKIQVLDKLYRNLKQLGLTVSYGDESVVVENGSNDLTISYVDKEIQKPMGGIDGQVTPFLGIGVAAPGQLKMKSAISTADDMSDVLDGAVAAQVFAMLCGFANDMVLENSDASFSAEIRGHADLLGMGS